MLWGNKSWNCFYRTSVLVSRSENKYSLNIPSQFIELRPFYGAKGNSGIESLLEDVTDNQIEDAINLVNGKVTSFDSTEI